MFHDPFTNSHIWPSPASQHPCCAQLENCSLPVYVPGDPNARVSHCYFNHFALNYASLCSSIHATCNLSTKRNLSLNLLAGPFLGPLAVLPPLLLLGPHSRSWGAPRIIQQAAIFTALLSTQPHVHALHHNPSPIA